MKVSIIVPVYNVEKYLHKCLDSLVKQTIDDYEVILVNDGSQDNSQHIIDEYKERFPMIIKSLVIDNGGQGRARNFGIEKAQGEFIGFADSDDWVDETMFEKLYEAAKATDADIASCNAISVSPDGREEFMNRANSSDPMYISGSVWNKLFRRSIIGDVRFPSGLWYEDLEFAVKLALKAEKIVTIQEPLYYYRVSPTSTMRNNNAKKNLDILTVLDSIKSYIDERGYNCSFDVLVLNHVLFEAINRVARQNSRDKKDVIKKLRAYVKVHVPVLSRSVGYKSEPLNRRIVMLLNYYGFEGLTVAVSNIKTKIRKNIAR